MKKKSTSFQQINNVTLQQRQPEEWERKIMEINSSFMKNYLLFMLLCTHIQCTYRASQTSEEGEEGFLVAFIYLYLC